MAERIAKGGMLTALAMIFSYVETLLPVNIGIPGVKLGLANLVVLAGLYHMRAGDVLVISTARIILLGFLFGNAFSIFYSLTGGLLSFFCMYTLLHPPKHGICRFSPTGVSAAGGVSHNIGQLLAAFAIVRTAGIFSFLPVLTAAGAVTGALTGWLTMRILAAMRHSNLLEK